MKELTEGTYTAEVELRGGSGRASVASPAPLYVRDGEIQAEITWSSAGYSYMEVDGVGYAPVSREGGSVFVIRVPGFDEEIPVLAETTAMSQPHTVAYTLCFDSASIRQAGAGPGWLGSAALLAAAVCLAGGALLLRRRGARRRGT